MSSDVFPNTPHLAPPQADYVVALVDVLNQRNILTQWGAACAQGDPQWTACASAKAVEQILWVREHLIDYLTTFRNSQLPERYLDGLADEERRKYLEWTEAELSVQYFSDTCILYAPARFLNNVPALKEVFGAIIGIGSLYPLLLSKGIVIRGAVEIGPATILYESEIYGPCLAEAYQLEQEEADYPRVVVGPRVVQLIERTLQLKGSAPEEKIALRTASAIRDAIVIDDDGRHAIHYLGSRFSQAADNPHLVKGIQYVHKAYNWVCTEHERWRQARNTLLARRYARLRRYFDHFIKDWPS